MPTPDPPGTVAPLRPTRQATPGELEQRVRELELGKTAQQDATRSIIRDSLSKIGPRINEFVTLSGSLEVVASRTRNFTGPVQRNISLNTAELDFDIKANEGVTGSLILAFDPGTSVTFPTTDGATSGVDRLTIDRATVTIGDTQRFPLYAKVGRDVLPFGTSTGLTRTSNLSLGGPLTIEVFETRATAIGFGFEFPTPEPGRPPPPVVVPPVQPLVISPLVNRFGRALGYRPPVARLSPLVPVAVPPGAPPYYGSINLYEGSDLIGVRPDFTRNVSGSLGYRTSGHCGRPYSELRDSVYCPWSVDFHVDVNSSIYNSNFLQRGYGAFLGQIGAVPGVAASFKATFGAFALTAEYNSAIKPASFLDGAGRAVKMQPAAWQLSLGYQFDWNPWVEKVGEQGTFVAIGYSASRHLGGVTQLLANGQATRVGFAPKSRLILTAGEWVLDGVKVILEASLDWDYSRKEGGTGKMGSGLFAALTYNF